MSNSSNPAHVVDGIRTIAIHNDVVRIQFMSLDFDGKPVDTVRLLVPMKQIGQIAEALAGLRPASGPAPAGSAAAPAKPATPAAAAPAAAKPAAAPGQPGVPPVRPR